MTGMEVWSITKELLAVVLTISLFFGGVMLRRSAQRQDNQDQNHKELEVRVRELERHSVTDEELRRIETKMDELFKGVNMRLDRIIESDR